MVQRGNVRVAAATRNFPKVCAAINAYGRARLPSWFTWTAIQVNHAVSPSATMPGHKHHDHLPLSAIVTAGDFLGWEFCVEEAGLLFPTRGTRPYTMACVAGPEGHDRVDEDGVALDARKRGRFFAVVLCTCQPRGVVNAMHWCFLPRSASARCRGRTCCCCRVPGSGCVPGSMCHGCSIRQHAPVVEGARTRLSAECVGGTVLHPTRCCAGAYALGS